VYKIELKKIQAQKKDIFKNVTGVETKGKVFVLYCSFENVSNGQVFAPIMRKTNVTIVDNFGNQMRSLQSGISVEELTFDGQYFTEIKPGEMLSTVFVIEKPKMETAMSYTCLIYITANNDDSINSIRLAKIKFVPSQFFANALTSCP